MITMLRKRGKGGYVMISVVSQAKQELAKVAQANSLTTGAVRAVSASLYRGFKDKGIENVLAFCTQLLEEREWALGVIAYDWAFRVRKQYNEKTFAVFEEWLKEYVTGWGDCDDFCTHAFGALLSQNNDLFTHVKCWTEHPNFAVRRAAAVVLIYPIKQGLYEGTDPFAISDALMHDDHYLVLKGYGWMLKVLSQVEPHSVYEYLSRNRSAMPRVALRYAAEKMDKDLRADLFR
jgi:3-methyladenine DNA glycosylase AlkD